MFWGFFLNQLSGKLKHYQCQNVFLIFKSGHIFRTFWRFQRAGLRFLNLFSILQKKIIKRGCCCNLPLSYLFLVNKNMLQMKEAEKNALRKKLFSIPMKKNKRDIKKWLQSITWTMTVFNHKGRESESCLFIYLVSGYQFLQINNKIWKIKKNALWLVVQNNIILVWLKTWVISLLKFILLSLSVMFVYSECLSKTEFNVSQESCLKDVVKMPIGNSNRLVSSNFHPNKKNCFRV